LQISFNVLNLFDQAASVSAFQTENGSGDGISFNEADFHAGQLNFAALEAAQDVSTDPRILMESVFQSPMRRFGVKFRF
jgi:hypothetical protein